MNSCNKFTFFRPLFFQIVQYCAVGVHSLPKYMEVYKLLVAVLSLGYTADVINHLWATGLNLYMHYSVFFICKYWNK